MKLPIVLIIVFISAFSASAQQEYYGIWEVYDTLSIEQTKLGSMTINKVKLLHEKITFNEDGSFEIEHIEPKGFHINANRKGTWIKELDGILLSYQDVYEDEQGKRTATDKEMKYLFVDNKTLQYTFWDGEMRLIKKK